MKVQQTKLPGVLILEPRRYEDSRGYFFELCNERRLAETGLPVGFVQDNVSRSVRGVLRGLHYQHPSGQGKLVTVLSGVVFDVAVDVRRGSPTFGQWVGEYLSEENGRQLYIPEGFAHGFVVLSDFALFHYKCTEYYDPKAEHTILWNDPDLGIEWPVVDPVLSEKDRRGVRLRDLQTADLPVFQV
jgi:dTDP-4-dehydrorhamnose 3,5-epimerase